MATEQKVDLGKLIRKLSKDRKECLRACLAFVAEHPDLKQLGGVLGDAYFLSGFDSAIKAKSYRTFERLAGNILQNSLDPERFKYLEGARVAVKLEYAKRMKDLTKRRMKNLIEKYLPKD